MEGCLSIAALEKSDKTSNANILALLLVTYAFVGAKNRIFSVCNKVALIRKIT